jgi:hypothetical protein
MREGSESRALTQRYYLYRGNAIRSLREQFDVEQSCTDDVVIAGVFTLLLVDVSPVLLET